jgi:hypothetical protein
VTVQSGTSSATTGADGQAALQLSSLGAQVVRATRVNDVPGQTTIQVSAAPPIPVPPDTAKPLITIGSIENDQVFKGHGPRELKGTAVDRSGVSRVRIRLTRIVEARDGRGKSCTTFSPGKAKFVKAKRCGAKHGKLFVVGTSADWSYLLPKELAKGRYVLDVEVTDGAGNTTDYFPNGVNRAKFRVT